MIKETTGEALKTGIGGQAITELMNQIDVTGTQIAAETTGMSSAKTTVVEMSADKTIAVETTVVETIVVKDKDRRNLDRNEDTARRGDGPDRRATGALDRRDGRRDKTDSFRDAGQLPDKPAPVVSEQPVTGLPDHLMPKATKRSSPPFERLRRTLSRSPSPIMHKKAVQSVASLLATNPTMDPEMAAKTHLLLKLHQASNSS